MLYLITSNTVLIALLDPIIIICINLPKLDLAKFHICSKQKIIWKFDFNETFHRLKRYNLLNLLNA